MIQKRGWGRASLLAQRKAQSLAWVRHVTLAFLLEPFTSLGRICVLVFKPSGHNLHAKDPWPTYIFDYWSTISIHIFIITDQSCKHLDSVGDKVFGQASVSYPTSDMAGFQEYALLDVQHGLAKIPNSFTVDQLVSLPVNAPTSFLALSHHTSLDFATPFPTTAWRLDASQQNVVIFGAGSQVGKLPTQFAKLTGIGTIIAVTAGSRTTEFKNIGATHVLDWKDPQIDLVTQGHGIVGGMENVTRIFDCANWTYGLAAAMATRKNQANCASSIP